MFKKKPKELNKKSMKAALELVDDIPNGGLKDIRLALDTVTQGPTLDTIYLLSSREPEVGFYVHWNRLTDDLIDINRFHKIVVHSIAYSDGDDYRDQLERIAKCTGGNFQFYE
ncbi:MAG: hypothetical protein ACI835_002519 [Planctomycetota bacterium]